MLFFQLAGFLRTSQQKFSTFLMGCKMGEIYSHRCLMKLAAKNLLYSLCTSDLKYTFSFGFTLTFKIRFLLKSQQLTKGRAIKLDRPKITAVIQ